MLTRVAQTILGNEKALSLIEANQQSPGSRGFHRYQLIYVVRDGEMAEFRRDMGLSKGWKGVKTLLIPSMLEHTVDELMDMADELRNVTRIDVKDWLELDNMKLA